jgi:hypothetical protein
MSGVSNGQTANQTSFNNAFIARNGDSNTIGKLDLENAEVESGDSIFNLQKEVNAHSSYTGMPPGSDADVLPTWTDASVGTGTDNLTERAEALTAEFNTSTGHTHDGTDSRLIDATDLSNVRLRGYFVRAVNLSSVTGSSLVVTTQMTGKTPSTADTVKGVVVTGANHTILRDNFSATQGDQLRDSNGDLIYGRITYAATVWTLSFYKNVAGVETAHSFTAQDVAWYYQELFSPTVDAPIYSELALVPSDNATQDVVDATASQRGLVSTGTQSFGGAKTFADTTQSTTKDTGAVILEGGLGVEKNINAGGTVLGSNLSGTNTGDVTLGAIGSSPNANGATLTGQVLVFQPADSTFGGVLTAIAQSILGVKTWVNGIVGQAYLALQRLDVASTASITQLATTKTFVKLTGSTATTIHGAAAGADGQILTIHNGSSAATTIKHQSGTATAADRFVTPTGLDLTVAANSSAEFVYDTGQSRWVIKSGSGSGSGGGALLVTGSRASPSNITAAGGIAFTGPDSRQLWFVQGDSADIDVTANPQIAAGSTVGQELVLVGRNDTQSLKLEDGTGLSLRGEIYLIADSVLSLFWDGTNWVETSRSG